MKSINIVSALVMSAILLGFGAKLAVEIQRKPTMVYVLPRVEDMPTKATPFDL